MNDESLYRKSNERETFKDEGSWKRAKKRETEKKVRKVMMMEEK